ncbi:copia protein [Lasius niger]|uniref:Copia protein n=1 Tax=Lasius niger TaxID=67767 RepID=A0A0J7K966_LASNI|nr:copia protein [Lasius niger]
MSTTEAEYIAASDATKELIWLRHLLESMGVVTDGPTTMKVDNQGAIKLIKNPEYHKRTKHIEVRYHFIREKHEDGQIEIVYVPSSDQLADILTKALSKEPFIRLRDQLQIEDMTGKFSTGGSVEESHTTAF